MLCEGEEILRLSWFILGYFIVIGLFGEFIVLVGIERVGVVVVVVNVGVGVGVKFGLVVVFGVIVGDVGDDSVVLELFVIVVLVFIVFLCDMLKRVYRLVVGKGYCSVFYG